jgi:hypothetical protein
MMPLIYMLPKSPRYLLKVGKQEEALKIISVLLGDGDSEHPDVKREFVDIMKSIEEDKKPADFDSYWRITTDFRKDRLDYAVVPYSHAASKCLSRSEQVLHLQPSTPQQSSDKPVSTTTNLAGSLVSTVPWASWAQSALSSFAIDLADEQV